jgi:hypothetical protein
MPEAYNLDPDAASADKLVNRLSRAALKTTGLETLFVLRRYNPPVSSCPKKLLFS